MALTKVVNGVVVEMTPEEEAAILAEWDYNKSPEKLAADLEQIKNQAIAQLDRQTDIIKALGEVLFEVVNEVRVLKGQSALTATQFKNYVKTKL